MPGREGGEGMGSRGRERGRDGWREGGREGWMEGGRVGGREGGREGGRKGEGREGGREGRKDGGEVSWKEKVLEHNMYIKIAIHKQALRAYTLRLEEQVPGMKWVSGCELKEMNNTRQVTHRRVGEYHHTPKLNKVRYERSEIGNS